MNLEIFHPAVARWFARTFPAPTDPQLQAWPEIKKHRHTLIAAPTGSGKTLAAFLSAIDDLVRLGVEGKLDDSTHVIYVSPLKALSNDVQRNLQVPLEGIQEELKALGLPEVNIRTLVRTGDTPAAERTAMTKRPPHIVVTTPESLYILLTSEGGRRMLETARTLIRRRNSRSRRRQTRFASRAFNRTARTTHRQHQHSNGSANRSDSHRSVSHAAADRRSGALPRRHGKHRRQQRSELRHHRQRPRAESSTSRSSCPSRLCRR